MAERASKRRRMKQGGHTNRRENSRIAAKTRRESENVEIYELARLLPLPSAVTSQLDKASVLRITISYMKMKDFFAKSDKGWLEGPLSIHPISPFAYLTGDSLAMPRLKALPGPENPEVDVTASEHVDHYALQALDGFILVLSCLGHVLYVSETVSGYLGLSQVDLLGRSLFEYVHIQDHGELKGALETGMPCCEGVGVTDSGIGERLTRTGQGNGLCYGRHVGCTNERNFFLRIKNILNKKGGEKNGINCPGYKVIHLAGRTRFAHGEEGQPRCLGLLAVCKPLDPPPMMEVTLSSHLFMSRHSLDLKFIFCDQRISQLTGYHPSDMLGRVVYHFHHPSDMSTIAGCHTNLISKGQSVSKSYRFLMKCGEWIWLQTSAVISYNTRSQKPQYITCYNYVISEEEGRQRLKEIGDTSPEWKKIMPVVELTDSQTQSSGKKKHSKLPSTSSVSSARAVQRTPSLDHMPASKSHATSFLSAQSSLLLEPISLTPSSSDPSLPVELAIFDDSPKALGDAIAQCHLAHVGRRKSSDENQPIVMNDIPASLVAKDSVGVRVVLSKKSKKRKTDDANASIAEVVDNTSTGKRGTSNELSELHGVVADALALEEEIVIPNEVAELLGSFPPFTQDEPVETKPAFSNGILALPPYPDPVTVQQPVCQSPGNWQPPVGYSAQSTGYPMTPFQPYPIPPLLPASRDSNQVNSYHASDLHRHHQAMSAGPPWPSFPQSSADQRPVIFSPAAFPPSDYQVFIAREHSLPGGRRTGLDAVQCSPYPASAPAPPPYYGMTASSGGSSYQMTAGRKTSPAESCAPLLGSESLQ